MEICSLKSVTASTIPRSGLLGKPFVCGRTINLACKRRYRVPRKLKVIDCRAQASGTDKVGSEALGAATRDVNSKDGDLVFVAGATGRVGSRAVRELLKLGFKVRAGVRSKQRAESLVQSVQKMKLDDDAKGGNQPIEKLEIVECDLEQRDQIGPALGKASVVMCCIGASEKEVFDITGPFRIDYLATKNLIDAATFAKVDHFILLTSLGTNKVGFPAAILNLFWGVLIWKRKAEEALLASGLPYTIVRPGGMERPTDSYKETHNTTLSEEDTLFGGQVSNLQVAELMAFMAKNRRLSYCKVVEVIAETTAPLTPMEELLSKVPSQRKEVYSSKESGDADGPGPAIADSSITEPASPSILKEPSPTKPALAKLLSPYTAYEDLKPPTSPSPTQSSTTGGSKASNLENLMSGSNSPLSAVEVSSSAASSLVTDSENLQIEVRKATVLSPYTNYYDLKPPASPSPNPPCSQKETIILEAASTVAAADSEANKIMETVADASEPKSSFTQPQTNKPSSPYTAYEDLKPPSSPSPTPSGPKESSHKLSLSSDITSQISGGNDLPNTGTFGLVEKDPPPSSASRHSPFLSYEDLKPPSSPSPNAPFVSGNGKPVPPSADTADTSGVTQQSSSTLKPNPLSPYTMYEDLKPPTSPSPSFKKP